MNVSPKNLSRDPVNPAVSGVDIGSSISTGNSGKIQRLLRISVNTPDLGGPVA